ncbi:MAG TPA: VTT domain-containing protein, partial [Vicinamibacterales bacterium]
NEPIRFGSTVTYLVPPADATSGLRPFRIPVVPAVVLIALVASTSAALVIRPEFQLVQDTLVAMPRLPSNLWAAVGAFVLGSLMLIPLELMVIAAGILFGALQGGIIVLIGSLAAAVIGYIVGRTVGVGGIVRWMSWRSYRSARQLGARGVIGVAMLRLASVASATSIHLLCGAGRVPFAAYMTGTAISLIPTLAALIVLGTLLRHTLLYPSVSNGLITIGTAVILVCVAAGLRTFLLARQFAPSVASHRNRAEFG